MAELVWLNMLQIKLVKMASGRGIYHKKTGILTDVLENHILHEGSDNFTRAAHSKNAEAVTFFYSWDSKLDSEAINDAIRQFDSEWEREDLSFDLSQEFLQQVLTERERRQKLNEPVIESISPPELPPGETTTVEITGKNLDKVENIIIPDDTLVTVTIESKEPESITATVSVDPDHPPTTLTEFQIITGDGTYITSPTAPPTVTPTLEISEYPEIVGYKQAVEIILSGAYGKPNDFLYWLAQQRPHQFQVESSDILDKLVYDGVLFEHQKSGAQHCLRVMQDFGVAVCADSVGLGKSRLAATVAKLYGEQNNGVKVAIIAAKKLHDNWEREMSELGFNSNNYELYNKNLMSRKGNNFLTEFNRYGGADIIILDEAHEGIRNYRNRIHRTCLQIQEQDRKSGRQRYFLLLTATPWNNRREDIYNILSPFLNRPEGFNKLNLPAELVHWFQNRDVGVENFTDNTEIFRRVYKELFLQRTRQMLREATPDMNLYAKRIAEWLPVEFEVSTEEALEQIFTQFEDSLFIPFADPIRYLRENVEQRSLLRNQRRLFLQRAESSMYALQRTIKAFGNRIRELQNLLQQVTPDADGLKQFLLVHYKFESLSKNQPTLFDLDDREAWDEDYEEEEEVYKKQETSTNVYTQTEILYGEELSKLMKELGDDYQANPITLGRRTGDNEPTGLIAMTVKYFGPNGEAIDSQNQTVFWNDQTGDKDGYGTAIATASKTPEAGDIFSTKHLLQNADNLYQSLIEYKQELQSELQQEDSGEVTNTTSERITRIQRRIQQINALPDGLDRKTVRDTLKKLGQWKATHKNVQKLLRDFTEGAKSKLDDDSFLRQLVEDTDELGLLAGDGIKATSLTVSLAAVLMRA